MRFTGKRIIQKIVAVLIIMMMTLADFSLIGANVVSYALDIVATNSNNVEFSAYFINEQKEKVTEIDSSINADNLKMYVEISVRNEGYFNGEITLGDSNFNFSENISNEYVKQTKGNTVTLNQINAGTTASIELKIDFINSNEIKTSSLSQVSEINLTGTYVNSKKNVDIKGKTSVKVNWKSPKDIEAKLDTKILTNSIYKVNDANKRIVQVLVNSKLNNNSYPVKETNIELNVPDGAEEVKVHARSTYATNGNENNFEYNVDSGKLTISLKNEEDDGKINWNKDVKDILVVTYVYPDNTIFNYEKINSNVTINTYDDKEVKAESQAIISENIDGIVTNEILEKEEEIYKGKIYTGEERDYTTTTILNIDYADVVKGIEILESQAKFKTDNETKTTNIQFVETKIEKSKFDKIFGEDGFIAILDQDGTTVANINKDSEVNDGNIVVKYNIGVKHITIKTSKPISNGILDIVHTKSILDSKLSRDEIKDIVEIQEEVKSKVIKNDGNEITNIAKHTIKLKETVMQNTIEINKETLTTESKNEGVIIQAKLLTYGEDKELYKNPIIKIELPKEIEKVEKVQVRILNGNGLELDKANINEENGLKVITIALKGEQKKYSKEVIEGTIIQLRLDCNISNLATSNEEKIILKGTNENTDDKIYNEAIIRIVNPNTMITVNKVSGYEENRNIKLDINEKERNVKANLQIINNEKDSISNFRVIGALPTNNTKNNLGITLTKGISVNLDDAKVYYTKEENATDDINDKNNKWHKEIPQDVKKYLIVVDNLDKSENITANYEIKIPENLKYNLSAESGYQVKYLDDTTSKEKQIDSTTLKLSTGIEAEIIQEVTASVGGAIIENGSEVRAGEIIKYEITLENKGNTDAEGVKVNGTVPNGTTRVILKEVDDNDAEIVYDTGEPNTYMDYVDSNDKNVVFDNIRIKQGEKIKLYYEVRVNNDISDNTQTTCQITTTYKNKDITNSINHNLMVSDISLKLGATYRTIGTVKSGYSYEYFLDIVNNSDKDQENLKVKLNTNEMLKIETIYYFYEDNMISYNKDEVSTEFNIARIKAKNKIRVLISTVAQDEKDNVTNASISANITDGNNVIYRSNEIIEKVETIQVDVKVSSTTNSSTKDNYVIAGDSIKYTITVKNSGEIDANSLVIKDKIINYLTIKGVKLNGEDVKYDKEISYEDKNSYTTIIVNKPLKAGEECTVEVNTSVNEITSNEILKVNNKAYVYNNICLAEVDGNMYYIKNKKENTIVAETGGKTEEPTTPSNPTTPSDPNKDKNTYVITGTVWYDENKDGEKTDDEQKMDKINVSLLNINSNEIVKTVETDESGFYTFKDIEKGEYIVIFEYDTELYIPTLYQADGISANKNSDAIQNNIKINNEYKTVAVTDNIKLNKDLSNIDLGLIKAEKFDLELHKYVTKISVINADGTKTYDFDKSDLAKVEIGAKYLKNSNVVIEYTIEVKNTGEVSGYVQNIVDYKPASLDFSSNMNKDWYQSGKYLYNDSLSKAEIKAGETKEITLVLSKTMTESNTGLVNNTAEISKVYNVQGIADADSVPGNNQKEEDDLGSADVIISVKTGAAVSYIALTLSVLVILVSAAYLINKKILKKYI